MKNLLIFDLDGTLFNSAPGILKALNKTLSSKSLNPISMDKLVKYIGHGVMSMIEDYESEHLCSVGDKDLFEREFLKDYDSEVLTGSHVFDGVYEFLKSWPGQLAILSNKKEHYVKLLTANSCLQEFQWLETWGGDSLKTKKPDPLGIQLLMERSQTTPQQTTMIGDGLPDIRAAQNAGIKSIAVSFGYAPIETLLSEGASAKIDHFSQLQSCLNSTLLE